MSRTAFSSVLCLLLAFSAMAADSHTPKANTRDAVKAYVQSAAKVVAKGGPSCATFADKSWMSGDYYVFVTGSDDHILCHPNAKLVGQPTSTIIDANGKHVGDLLQAAARGGGGWVDYVWPRPGTTNPVAKSTYSMAVTGPDGKQYFVGAGGYELK